MATRQVRRNNLIGKNSLSFIRPQTLTFSVKDTKPSTTLYAFFDGVSVDSYITPSGGSLGDPLVTNAAGVLSGTFAIPPMTFNTGERIFKLQDSDVFDESNIPGSTAGSASATFTAQGVRETWRETITNINRIEILENPPVPFNMDDNRGGNDGGGLGDPLAQTFFTYGVKGGCFVTKIDLYFQSKDATLPVICEIRNVVNGYPGPLLVSKYAHVSLPPASVNISADASAVTTFTFARPIYLEENKDYCFVLLANSNAYNVWTSEFGQKSIETGKTIFEQPFIGTLFKSENNITWTAEQTQDIKFTLYKAEFDTSPAQIIFKANSSNTLVYGSYMSVTSGSPIVSVTLPFMHGHRTGDKVSYSGISSGSYRGIPSATISNVLGFTVTVVDEYTYTFNVGANATSTGTLSASGILNAVEIDNGGTGYTAPTIAFTGGGGTGAAATLSVTSGVITGVTITNVGSGYTSSPATVVTDSMGSPGVGAVLTAISEAIFVTSLNRKYQSVVPVLFTEQPPDTNLVSTLRTSSEAYVVGQHANVSINTKNDVAKEAVVVNDFVENSSFGSTSTEFIVRLESDNKNVSPVIDLNERPRLRLNNNIVGTNITNETTASSGVARARYISKKISLATLSKGARVVLTAASISSNSLKVYFRTSKAGTTAVHDSLNWTAMSIDTDTNLSRTLDEFKEYTFYLNDLADFDVYDLKIVMTAQYKNLVPKIANYRVTILAT